MTRSPLGAALLHPAAIGALVVLVLNDHVLKAWQHSWLTGKLSDFAGMLLAPLVLVALADAVVARRWLTRRYVHVSAWVAALAVMGVFALTKTWAPATRAYETSLELARLPLVWLWGASFGAQRVVLVRDPSDLIALPLGLLAARLAARRFGRVEALSRPSGAHA